MNKYEVLLAALPKQLRPTTKLEPGDRFIVTRDMCGAVNPGRRGSIIRLEGFTQNGRTLYLCTIDGSSDCIWSILSDALEPIQE